MDSLFVALFIPDYLQENLHGIRKASNDVLSHYGLGNSFNDSNIRVSSEWSRIFKRYGVFRLVLGINRPTMVEDGTVDLPYWKKLGNLRIYCYFCVLCVGTAGGRDLSFFSSFFFSQPSCHPLNICWKCNLYLMSGLANEETWSTLTFLREQTTKDFILSRRQNFPEINRDIFVSLEQ